MAKQVIVTAANWKKRLKSIADRGATLESDIQACTIYAMDRFATCTTFGAHCAELSELRQIVHGVKGLNGRKFDKYVEQHTNAKKAKDVNEAPIFKLAKDTAPTVEAPKYPWNEQDMSSNKEPKVKDTNDLMEELKKGVKSKHATLGYKVACVMFIKLMGTSKWLKSHAAELEAIKAKMEEAQETEEQKEVA